MPPKICILTTAHPVFCIRIFQKQARALARQGYLVSLIAQHDRLETVDGVRIVNLEKAGSRIHRLTSLGVKAFLLALKEKADVYHFHDPELLPVGVALKIFTGKKVIYDVHEDYSKQVLSKPYLPKFTRRIAAVCTKMLETFSILFVDGIITATDNISENFVSHKKVISVHNFPVVSRYEPLVCSRDNNKTFNLVYVGGLSEIRGIGQIIKATDLLDFDRPIKLTLCGDFYSRSYEMEVRSLKGFQKTDYLGRIDTHRIPALLQSSDAGIVCFLPEPNHLNSMPTKLFEYMAAGLPVIASNFPLWESIIVQNGCGLCVDPSDPRAIASAIEYFVDHPEDARIMGQNGRRLALEKYSWNGEERKLLDMYREFAEHP